MEIRATLFGINECGYYKRGEDSPEFGNIDAILSNLSEWADGEQLSETKLSETDIENGVFPIYLLDIKRTLNGWAIACWNEVPATDGRIGAIKLDTRVGDDLDIAWSNFDDDAIPGFPSYYWINTRLNIVTAIAPKLWSNSIKSLEKYLKDFMRSFSEYVVLSDDNDIIGYSESTEVEENLLPKFKISLLKRINEIDYVVEHFQEITKISKKGLLKQLSVVDSGAQTGIVRWLSGDPRKEVVARDAQVKVVLEYTPTQEEVIQMIREEDQNEHASRWDDLGFYIPGKGGYIWVNRSKASDIFDIEAQLNNQGILSIDTIDNIIREHGHQFIALRDRRNDD